MEHMIRKYSRLHSYTTRKLMNSGARPNEGIEKLSLGIALQRVNVGSESAWACTVCRRAIDPLARVMEAAELWLEEPGSRMAS